MAFPVAFPVAVLFDLSSGLSSGLSSCFSSGLSSDGVLPGVPLRPPWGFPGVSSWISPVFPRGRPRGCPGVARGEFSRGGPGALSTALLLQRLLRRTAGFFPHEALILMVLPGFFVQGADLVVAPQPAHHTKANQGWIDLDVSNFCRANDKTIQVNVCMADLHFQTS